MTLLLLFACRTDSVEADDPCPAEYTEDLRETDARAIGVMIPSDEGTFDIHADLRWPDGAPTEDMRWPVAVVAHGGWAGRALENQASASVAGGLVAVHFDLPGESLTAGLDDRRGAAARSVVAAVLRYASGDVIDSGGCTLTERTVAADGADLYLVGTSNGGNLAIATLADPALDLPDVAGLVTWETPAGAIFATVALGNDPTVYRAGTCTLDQESAISCPFPEDRLVAASGDVCFDLDADLACGRADVPVAGVQDPVSGKRMIPPELLDALGATPSGYADADDAAVWWAERDGAHLSPALVAAQPDLPIVLLASEEDHVLALSDHPHIYGLGGALQDVGAAWTRLNPGAEWLPAFDAENDPDARLSLADASGALLPEDVENPLADTLAAAVFELSSRRSEDRW